MDAVALWVASLPGAFGRVTAFGTGPLLLGTLGLLLLALLKTPLRWSGAAVALVAALWAARTPVPDVLVAGDGRSFAVRGADGRLTLHHGGGDTFAAREWLAADADGRDIHDATVAQGIACDGSGCIGALSGGALVAYALAPSASEEDCGRALLVIVARGEPPPDCAASVIGRDLWRRRGALALRRTGDSFSIEAVRPADYDRPWAPAPHARSREGNDGVSGEVTGSRAAPKDATPAQDDIEADR
jgi:competence protein ComEC